MEKYKNYLENKFEKWQIFIAIICAVVVLVAIFVEMAAPVDSNELANHYAQLETIKLDVTNICQLKDADISIEEDGMTVKLNGKYHHLKAYFDENKHYIKSTVEDNRLGSNIIISILAVLVAGWFAYIASYSLWAVLWIPFLVYKLIEHVKEKYHNKKAK